MQSAPLPDNERERQLSLEKYHLDTRLPREDYDDVTKVAAEICGVPISIITILDKDKQRHQSAEGMDLKEVPRNISFCGHTIVQPEDIFIIPDARYDERFHDNPLTVGDPHIVFYAGVPLINKEGYALGALCVIDHRPRELTDMKISALKSLARLAMQYFERRRAEAEKEASVHLLQEASTAGGLPAELQERIQKFLDGL